MIPNSCARSSHLALAGMADRLFAPHEPWRGLFERIAPRDKALIVCGRETGFAEDFDHTGIMVHRAARAQVWPRTIDWLLSRGH